MNNLKDLPEGRLTIEEQRACSETIQRFKDGERRQAAIDKLVVHSMRDAIKYAYRCSRGGLAEDELFSLCYDALKRAAKNFKSDKQQFLPYAKPYIRGHVSTEFQKLSRLRRAGPLPVAEESDEGPLPSGDESEEPKPALLSTEPDFGALHSKEIAAAIRPYIKRLSAQEQAVIALKYEAGYSFEEIGKLTNSSRSAAWGTHARALDKLRQWLSAHREELSIDS